MRKWLWRLDEASFVEMDGGFELFGQFWVYGTCFQSRRPINEELRPPLSLTFLPTFFLEIIESRAIARFKAKSITNSLESTVWHCLPFLRLESDIETFGHVREPSERF